MEIYGAGVGWKRFCLVIDEDTMIVIDRLQIGGYRRQEIGEFVRAPHKLALKFAGSG